MQKTGSSHLERRNASGESDGIWPFPRIDARVREFAGHDEIDFTGPRKRCRHIFTANLDCFAGCWTAKMGGFLYAVVLACLNGKSSKYVILFLW
ncbi:MAG: hypothetical protein Q4G66_04730 [bacterium]|nr:hypothetical protein [bacterium]